MVSSKCCQVESPSPLRFLAALIPPCAHTEWERFTGTMENRSTCPPFSAILMTAAKPARPPPTTMILGMAAMLFGSALLRCAQGRGPCFDLLSCRRIYRSIAPLWAEKRAQREHADHYEDEGEAGAKYAEAAAGPLAHHQAPLSCEQPDAIAEVPRSRHDPHNVKSQCPGVLQLLLYFPKSCPRVPNNVDSEKAHSVGVPSDIKKGDGAGPALHGVHPVALPGIAHGVGVAAVPDVKAIKRVKGNRYPDKQRFNPDHEGQSGQKLDLVGVSVRTICRKSIGKEMFGEECAHRNYPAKRVQPSP